MEGVDVQHHPFSTSALDEDDWAGSLTSRFTPGERAFCTHCIQSLVDLGTGRGGAEKIKIYFPRWESNRDYSESTPQPSQYAVYATGFMFNLQVQRKIA
jgi:hypothetical protein